MAPEQLEGKETSTARRGAFSPSRHKERRMIAIRYQRERCDARIARPRQSSRKDGRLEVAMFGFGKRLAPDGKRVAAFSRYPNSDASKCSRIASAQSWPPPFPWPLP